MTPALSRAGVAQVAKIKRARAGGGKGRCVKTEAVHDVLEESVSVVKGTPTPEEYVPQVVNEMKIRGYKQKTIKNYRGQLIALLRWHGGRPHQIKREHVKAYLLTIAESGGSRSRLSGALAAIRTIFDDFCCRNVTLGLQTPRGVKKLPTILSTDEVRRLIDGCPSQRDKMLVSLMYATGMRVSEVVQLRWRNIDFDRNYIQIVNGKGSVDRVVLLPESYRPLLRQLSQRADGEDYLFASQDGRVGRHLSPRTVQRVVERSAAIAQIQKRITPHSLRHAYATHLFESGTDIRLIQQHLGHANLQTTCIYTKVSKQIQAQAQSPLDALNRERHRQSDVRGESQTPDGSQPTNDKRPTEPVGRMRLLIEPEPESTKSFSIEIEIIDQARAIRLIGVRASFHESGWLALQVPTLESWQEQLDALTTRQRERIESPKFYAYLQNAISARIPAHKPAID